MVSDVELLTELVMILSAMPYGRSQRVRLAVAYFQSQDRQ